MASFLMGEGFLAKKGRGNPALFLFPKFTILYILGNRIVMFCQKCPLIDKKLLIFEYFQSEIGIVILCLDIIVTDIFIAVRHQVQF